MQKRMQIQLLQEHNLELEEQKNKQADKIIKAVRMIDKFDYLHDNAFTLIREIKNTLTN